MIFIAITMLVILILAVVVLLYVAFPHRGEELPAAPWLSEAMGRAAEAAPMLGAEEEHAGDEVGVRRFLR